MRKIIILLISLFFFLFTPIAKADEGWIIDNFKSNITIQADGKVHVIEDISVDFNTLIKHGIYRDIPYIYYFENNDTAYADIQVLSVLQNNQTVTYKTSTYGNYLRLKIGDANKTLSEKQSYQITYLASGVIKSFEDHDELYWDATGNGWPVPITHAASTVTLPQNGIIGSLCFEGPFGSTEKCTAHVISQSKVSFESTQILNASEGLTIILGFTKGMVPILQVTPPVSSNTSSSSSSYSYTSYYSPDIYHTLSAFLATTLLGLATSYFLWYKHGRDTKGPSTIVVHYTAPNKLRPAEIGTILDERADTVDVSATIIDFATRGFLTITEQAKKWLFGSTDYILIKKHKDIEGLEEYEKTLLSKLFDGKDSVKVSELKMEFYDDLAKVKQELYKDVVDKKYFDGNPETVRRKYIGLGVAIIMISLIGIFIGFFDTSGYLEGCSWGLFATGFMFIILAMFMPKRTPFGRETYQKIIGFRMFMEKAENYRQKFFEKENIFNELLPYAMVFGITEKFAKALADLGVKPPEPSWYIGTHPFNPILFSSHVNNFSNSLTSAIASQPRHNSFASSRSGFSSGGGFSGGGGGGGGGGSW